jgi:hypothetical protein
MAEGILPMGRILNPILVFSCMENLRKIRNFHKGKRSEQFKLFTLFLLAFTEEKNNAKIENYTKSKILTVIFVFSLDSSLGKKVTGTQCKHTIDTGTWFIQHPRFQTWLSSEIPSVLWVKGIRKHWFY